MVKKMVKIKKLKPNVKERIKEQFKTYCKHSTMHGIYYLYRSTGWATQATWLMVLVCAAALNIYLSNMIWQQYVTDPTVTVVESTHYPTNLLPFPGIVLCDSDLVYGPRSNEITDILEHRGFTKDNILKFFDSISNFEDPHYTHDPSSRKIHSLLDDIGYSFLTLLDKLSKPCEELLIKCMWRSQQHNCSNMFRRVLNFKGYCCSFDIEYFRKNVDSGTNLATYPDRTSALEIFVNAVKILPNGTQMDGDTHMYIFDTADKLTPLDSSSTLQSRVFFEISIGMTAMDASDAVKALAKDVRKCILPIDNSESGSNFYSGCVANTLMMEIVNQCRCLPYFHNFQNEDMLVYPDCSWNQYKCVMETRLNFFGSPAEILSFKNCFEKCDYVHYEAQINYVELYRVSSLVDYLAKTKIKSLSEISIHIADRNCMKYRREVLFTWDQMLANIGGIYGLCMGGSIISIVELLWFLLDLMYVISYETILLQIHRELPMEQRIEKNLFLISNSANSKVAPIKYSEKRKTSGKVFPFMH